METFLSFFIFNDSYVVSFLVFGITIIMVLLLLTNEKSSSSVVKTEVGNSDNIEGALRRVLGEKNWVGSEGTPQGGNDIDSVAQLTALEEEVLDKDRKIAELNTLITQGKGGGGEASDELLKKIAELEERLTEYEIIEDDIADLSLYKTENDQLKDELEKLKSQLPKDDVSVEPATEAIAKEPQKKDEEESGALIVHDTEEVPAVVEGKKLEEDIESMSEDLVAEFEKIVDSQGTVAGGEEKQPSGDTVTPDVESGQVLMSDQIESKSEGGSVVQPNEVHPKLKNIDPDSKEEAEVFISDLKSLKRGS